MAANHDPTTYARLAPEMGEAEKVEPVRRSMSTGLWPEVHVPRLGQVKRQPMFRRTRIQCGEHALAVPTAFKDNDKVIAWRTSRKAPTLGHVRVITLPALGFRVRRCEVRRISLRCVDIAPRINESAVPGLRPPQATKNPLSSWHSPSPTGD